MLQLDRLKLELDEHNQRWKNVSDTLSRLHEAHDNETRVEEKIRQESVIREKQQQREAIEQQLQTLEAQIKQLETDDLIHKAQQATQNKAYEKAIQLWEQVLSFNPDKQQASDEISKLKTQLQQQNNAKQLIAGLIERMAEIQPVFADVVKILNNPMADISLISEQTEKFINQELSAEQYISVSQALINTPATSNNKTNYTALTDRIQRGEIVLFIGSNLMQADGQNTTEEKLLADLLAKKVGYSKFNGSLSSIAELYQMLPEFGRKSLLNELDTALPSYNPDISLEQAQNTSCIKFYESLAKIEAPLVLISSVYDNLLEQTFLKAGKKFAELSSIINRSDDYDIGHVMVRYSDSYSDSDSNSQSKKPENKSPEKTYIEEELSRLRLLEEGYSLIYKIRGTSAQSDALTLAESNYFTFARYGKKIIPAYLARQFRDRGFLFLGFSPKNWEDRLLVNTLLKKRQHSPEPCYTIGTTLDKMEAAYWDSCNVKEYQANLQELDKHLQEAVS